jgi:hypothetical protein
MDFCGLTAVLFAYLGILVVAGKIYDDVIKNWGKNEPGDWRDFPPLD